MAGYIGSKASVTQVDGYNRAEADAEFVDVTGDTMTGNLTVPMVVTQSALSNRNLIINGAMQVAQRGTSFTGNAYTLDRWLWVSDGADATITQDSLAPSPFNKSLKVDVTATKSPSSGTYAVIIQRSEAFNFDQTGWGTADGKPVTMSFYTYTNKTGTYSLTFKAANGGFDVYVATYTVTATDTWERHEITIPAPSTWNARGLGASAGAEIGWWLAGQNTETATPNQWLTVNANMASTQVNLFDNTANYFYLTGVQLEAGDTATPFEHRSYGQELALCQRYYQKIIGAIYGTPGSVGYALWYLKTSMRATPTITGIINGTSDYTTIDHVSIYTGSGYPYFSSPTADAEL